jgi:membrane associated rhomboid family serine protease
VTPWVLRIIFANVVVFFLQQALPPDFWYSLALVPALAWMRPWTLVTYMFLHGGLGHIFFNMLVLYFFGPVLEARLGSRHFLQLYFASGLAGGLLSIALTPFGQAVIPIIGASGAVFGVQLGFAYFWPRQQIHIWGILPIEARWLVVIMTVLALWGGFMGAGGGIAHFAHLGGFAGGYLYLKWLERRRQAPIREWRAKAAPTRPTSESSAQAVERWTRIRREDLHEVNRDELDRILDKISARGLSSLTAAEREFLDRFSARS